MSFLLYPGLHISFFLVISELKLLLTSNLPRAGYMPKHIHYLYILVLSEHV